MEKSWCLDQGQGDGKAVGFQKMEAEIALEAGVAPYNGMCAASRAQP